MAAFKIIELLIKMFYNSDHEFVFKVQRWRK